MCSPTLALTAVSTVFSAYQQMQQGKAEARSIQVTAQNNQQIAEYNAKVSEQNAELNKRAADDAIVRGANDAATIRENARRANAKGRAIMGGSGLIADTGNNLDLLLDNTAAGEINALTVFNNAEREAYGYKVAETSDRAQAENLRFQGRVGVANANYQASVVKNNGLLSGASTLVTGGSDWLNRYSSGKKETWANGSSFRTR